MAKNELIVLPTLRALRGEGGGVVLTQKFVEGMQQYAAAWQGPVTTIMEETDRLSPNLDNVELQPADLPFGLELISYSAPELKQRLAEGGVVLAGVSNRQNRMSSLCADVSVPTVYTAELTLRTRIQIARAEEADALRMMRRSLWNWNQERLHRAALRKAQGVQCNGVPTYKAYYDLTPSPHLYFDNRTTSEMLANPDQVEKRCDRLGLGRPLRLAFSGRLNKIKGADDLVAVAEALRGAGVAYEMMICGGGPLEDRIRADLDQLGLSSRVTMRGVLDFAGELVPLMKEQVDLFVCCHRQGDPSCTYVETLGCGVPIVGYDNEAFKGLLEHAAVGAAVKMNRPAALAQLIGELEADRRRLVTWSRNAIRFASDHTVEKTFASRIEHLRGVGMSLAGPE